MDHQRVNGFTKTLLAGLSSAVLMGATFVPAGAAAAVMPVDTEAPVVAFDPQSIPSVISLSGTDHKIDVSVRIKDATAVHTPEITASHFATGTVPDDGIYRGWRASLDMKLASGTTKDGTWKTTISVPRGLPSGELSLHLFAGDVLNNLPPEHVVVLGDIKVTNNAASTDWKAPAVELVSVSKTTADTTAGNDKVSVRVRLADSSGVSDGILGGRLLPRVDVSRNLPGGGTFWMDAPLRRDGGTLNNAVWVADLTLPKGMPAAQYALSLQDVKDVVGNQSPVFALGKLVVRNSGKPDTTGPIVVSTKVSASKVNVYGGGGKVTVRRQLSDPAGVQAPQLAFANQKSGQALPGSDSELVSRATLESGTIYNGVWVWTYHLPESVPTGKWDLIAFPNVDTLGNLTIVDPISSESMASIAGTVQLDNFAPKNFSTIPVPAISGTGTVGQTLQAAPGAWKPGGATFTYQWFRDGQTISGATKAAYKVLAVDAGKQLTVKVSATLYGHNKATSKASAVKTIAKMKFTTAPTPTVSGSATVGKKLTANPGAWKPTGAKLAYQWLRDGKAISKATQSTYTLGSADAGRKVSVKVTATKVDYLNTSKTSKPLTVAPAKFVKAPVPKISGTTKVGKTLTANPGTWSPKPTAVKYQWLRDGKAISKATKATYKLLAADRGKKISVKLVASKPGYTTISKTSAKSKPIAK
jgi:hypothetical protein